MDYTIEKNGETVLRLANGDRIMIKLVFGCVTPAGTFPNGTPQYDVQAQTAIFPMPAERQAGSDVSVAGKGKH